MTTLSRLSGQLLDFNGHANGAGARIRCTAATNAARDVLWAQLAGMTGRVVPATTSSKAPGFEGWWLVRSAPVGFGWPQVVVEFVDVGLELEHRGRAAEVRHEVRLIGGVLTNAQSLGDADEEPIYAPPGGHSNWTGDGTALVRESADGNVTVYRDVTRGSFPSWTVDPADYYVGAPTLTVGGEPVVGLASRPGTWQLGNGLVRVSQSAGDLLVESWDPEGDAWSSSTTFDLADTAGSLTITWGDALVLFDTGEQVACRVSGTDSNGVAWQLDLSVRRGARLIRARLFRASGTSAISISSGEASTGITGGLHSTAADAAGNRAVIVCLQTSTKTTATGTVTAPDVDDLVVWLGHEIGGASAVDGDAAADLVAQTVAGVDVAERAVRA